MIYAKAAQGEEWARKFIRDSGHTPPPVKKNAKKQSPLHKAMR